MLVRLIPYFFESFQFLFIVFARRLGGYLFRGCQQNKSNQDGYAEGEKPHGQHLRIESQELSTQLPKSPVSRH